MIDKSLIKSKLKPIQLIFSEVAEMHKRRGSKTPPMQTFLCYNYKFISFYTLNIIQSPPKIPQPTSQASHSHLWIFIFSIEGGKKKRTQPCPLKVLLTGLFAFFGVLLFSFTSKSNLFYFINLLCHKYFSFTYSWINLHAPNHYWNILEYN